MLLLLPGLKKDFSKKLEQEYYLWYDYLVVFLFHVFKFMQRHSIQDILALAKKIPANKPDRTMLQMRLKAINKCWNKCHHGLKSIDFITEQYTEQIWQAQWNLEQY